MLQISMADNVISYKKIQRNAQKTGESSCQGGSEYVWQRGVKGVSG